MTGPPSPIPDLRAITRWASQNSGVVEAAVRQYAPPVTRDLVRSARRELEHLARRGFDWVGFSAAATEALTRVVPFSRSCWHTVDPGTVLFTGSLNRNVGCSGAWLAEYEYVVDDVNRWWFLARSGRLVGATSLATHGDLSRSARHRSRETYGIGDELRASFVADGVYWGAAGFLRNEDEPWFTEQDVRLLAAFCEPLAHGFRRALLAGAPTDGGDDDAPGVIVFDRHGDPESISPAAERWIAEIPELPPPASPSDSKMIRIVATRARSLAAGQDPLGLAARSRVQTTSGRWLLLYGSQLSGGATGRTAVIIQQAPVSEIAPIIALAYGLSERERQVTQLCIEGRSTKQIARALHISPYTVDDHLKAIFAKTGVRTRGELVGQVFLEHYVPRWETHPRPPHEWQAFVTPAPPTAPL
jgi:DNA-binding CsgD family transcriptional regulator